jgi:predicted Zn finger-like uncharacterized protein
MNITVSCPSCDTSFPVDTTKIPSEGVRAQCSVCPEIFDVDRPNGVATEAPPAPEPMVDTIESADPLESGAVDLPPIEGGFEGDGPLIQAEPSAEAFAQIEPEPEVAEPEEVVAAEVSSESEPASSDAAAAAGADAESPGPIRFGRRSPADKAKSLARSLVSDLIAYNPEKHKEAVTGGNLQEVFGEEIEKSLKEYQEQVEPDVIAEGSFFNDALNSILAEGQDIFSLDN